MILDVKIVNEDSRDLWIMRMNIIIKWTSMSPLVFAVKAITVIIEERDCVINDIVTLQST